MQAPAKCEALAAHALDFGMGNGLQRLDRLSANPDGRFSRQFLDFGCESPRLLLQLGALLFEQAGPLGRKLVQHTGLFLADLA